MGKRRREGEKKRDGERVKRGREGGRESKRRWERE